MNKVIVLDKDNKPVIELRGMIGLLQSPLKTGSEVQIGQTDGRQVELLRIMESN